MTDLEPEQPIIVKKIKKGGHGHHGGAWKVAYADFVTAMMAFFLLLWLLNATTEEQKAGLADYFSPASVANPSSGSGSVLGGQTISVEGNQVSAGGPSEGGVTLPIPPSVNGREVPAEEQDPTAEESGGAGTEDAGSGDTETEIEEIRSQTADKVVEEEVDELLARREQERFEAAEEELRQAIESVPELVDLQDSLLIEQTPEGLRIQLVDQDGLSMFALGSADANDQLKKLISLVAQVVSQLPNKLSISGHTDSRPFRNDDGYSNWELSSDRANAARRLLIDEGLDLDRVANVQGRAATEPLLPEDTTNASNRRISMVLLREANLAQPGLEDAIGAPEEAAAPPPAEQVEPQRPPVINPGAPARDARTRHLEPPS